MLYNSAYQPWIFPIFLAKMNHMSKMHILAFVYLLVQMGLTTSLWQFITHVTCAVLQEQRFEIHFPLQLHRVRNRAGMGFRHLGDRSVPSWLIQPQWVGSSLLASAINVKAFRRVSSPFMTFALMSTWNNSPSLRWEHTSLLSCPELDPKLLQATLFEQTNVV